MVEFDIETVSNEDARSRSEYFDSENTTMMRLDVNRVVKTLSPKDQRICVLLSEGRTRTFIAQKLGKSRTAVSNDIARIREVFKRHKLQIYIKD